MYSIILTIIYTLHTTYIVIIMIPFMEIKGSISKQGNLRVIVIQKKYMDELDKSCLYDADNRGYPLLKITINKV